MIKIGNQTLESEIIAKAIWNAEVMKALNDGEIIIEYHNKKQTLYTGYKKIVMEEII